MIQSMKIKRLTKRRADDPNRVSLLGVNTNTLSLILINAKENIERELKNPEVRPVITSVMANLLVVINQIESFVDEDDPWMKPELEFED